MTIQGTAIAEKKQGSTLITTGLALFSMFFGAGNLIFPLLIGKSAGENTWFAILGLGLTAVVVPFLGLAAMILFQADYKSFFGRMGKYPGIAMLLLLQLILGPLGVIPRLVTLMYAMAKPYLFNLPLMLFSFCACSVIFFCCFKRKNLIGLLGAILTPVLLISLAALIYFGLSGENSVTPTDLSGWASFKDGLVGGYNTMDLIAAFLFATVVLPHFKQSGAPGQSQHSVIKKMIYSCVIAASLLLLTYIGLAWISSFHSWTIEGTYASEELLGLIAVKILGPAGGCIAAIAVILACLTTAITLASIFSDYLQKDLCKGKIRPGMALALTLLVSMLFANLGFSGIVAFLGPILQVVYPGLILLTILNLFHALYGFRMVKMPVFTTFAGALVYFS